MGTPGSTFPADEIMKRTSLTGHSKRNIFNQPSLQKSPCALRLCEKIPFVLLVLASFTPLCENIASVSESREIQAELAGVLGVKEGAEVVTGGGIGVGMELVEPRWFRRWLVALAAGDGERGAANLVCEFLGREDFDVVAPGENPSLNFLQRVELQAEFERAVFAVLQDLGFVPLAFADDARGKGIEAQMDLVVAGSVEDAKAVGEQLGNGEILWAAKAFARLGLPLNTVQHEGAQLTAPEVVREEIPPLVDAGQMERLHAAALGLSGVELEVVEGQFARL